MTPTMRRQVRQADCSKFVAGQSEKALSAPTDENNTMRSDPQISRRNCLNTIDTIYSCTHNTAVYAIIQQQQTAADPGM